MWHRKCSWGSLNSGALWEEGLVKEQGSTLALPLQPCLLPPPPPPPGRS